MSNNKERKNLNYNLKPNKDFSFRNDDINDENENPNKSLISNSSSKQKMNVSKENKKNLKKMSTKKNDSLNQLIINRLVQENKFLKEELEIAKSNILILEEKESQYKDTIDHINVINKEKEISYKNIMCLINNYKNRENQFNYKLSLYSKELMKKNKIIKELNTKINELKERIISLKNILSEKNRIINYMSKNIKTSPNHCNQSFNFEKNDTISKSLDKYNHNRKESDVKLYTKEKTLSNLNYKFSDFNSVNLNNINKKISTNRINTINSMNLHEKLNITNNSNSNYFPENDNFHFNSNTETSGHVTKLIRKNSACKKIINSKNNVFKNISYIQPMKKNNSFGNVSYNSVNSTINKNQNSINNSINLNQYKKPNDKKIFKNLKINSDKRETKKMYIISPSIRYPEINSNKSNNQINDYPYLSIDEEKYLISNDKKNLNKNKNGNKFNKIILNDKKHSNTNEYYIPKSNNKIKNVIKNNRKIEINKFYISNERYNSNHSFGNILTERNKLF